MGLRVAKTDWSGPGNTQRTYTMVTDGVDPASPVLSDGYTVYTPGISERTSSVTTFYHMDAQGSVVATTSSAQAQTGDMRYDAFGNKTYYVNTAKTFGWNAKSQYQTDAYSGLMLLGNRYYDCSTGRFISQDPAQDESNWYAYCGNNPLVAVDPSGLTAPPTLGQTVSDITWGLIGATIALAADGAAGALTAPGGGVLVAVAAAPEVATAGAAAGVVAGRAVNAAVSAGYSYLSKALSGGGGAGESGSGGNGDEVSRARAIRSTEKQIAAHENKLAEYRANPMKYDNKNLLKNTSPELRQKIIQGRIIKLQKEIRTYKNQLEELHR